MQKRDHLGRTWLADASSTINTGNRVLFVEDVPDEVELAVLQLQRSGIRCVHQRVETEHQLREALSDFRPDLVLSDFGLPQFDGQSALRIAHDVAADIPFIFLSGTIGEECAIEALLHGAADYVLKDNIKRLAPAVRRVLERAAPLEIQLSNQFYLVAMRDRLTREFIVRGASRGVRLTNLPRVQTRSDVKHGSCRKPAAM